MQKFFSDFWNDEARFIGLVRGVMVLVAGAITTGVIPLPASFAGWVGAAIPLLLNGAAVAIPAGQTNPGPLRLPEVK